MNKYECDFLSSIDKVAVFWSGLLSAVGDKLFLNVKDKRTIKMKM